ncbi:SMI1/KNR4 family protein [Streptomyces sp. NPDC001514]
MEMRRLVAELMAMLTREYLADSPVGTSTLPRLHPPATGERLAALADRAGQPLEPRYEEFLRLTDGLEGFYLDMPVLGCRDWEGGPTDRASAAISLLGILRESGIPEDVGLPSSSMLFPVSVNRDASEGIFLVDSAGAAPERFWLTGEGDSMFFEDFAELIGWVIDSRSCSPRETVD